MIFSENNEARATGAAAMRTQEKQAIYIIKYILQNYVEQFHFYLIHSRKKSHLEELTGGHNELLLAIPNRIFHTD